MKSVTNLVALRSQPAMEFSIDGLHFPACAWVRAGAPQPGASDFLPTQVVFALDDGA